MGQYSFGTKSARKSYLLFKTEILFNDIISQFFKGRSLPYMKSKILKVIFILSFIPYILIIPTMIFQKHIVNGVELKGLERVIEVLNSYFTEYAYITPIIPVCLTFQMCYIFRKNDKVMFGCTFIPYLFLLLIGLQTAIFGGTFIGDTVYYGLEGFEVGFGGAFIYYSFLYPILPICLIFQIILIVVKLRKRKANSKASVSE